MKPVRLDSGSIVNPGERTGPGFEGVRCPSCGETLRLRPGGFGESFLCPCGFEFDLESLGCRPMETETLAAAGPSSGSPSGPATMLVVTGADPEGTETIVGAPKAPDAPPETRAEGSGRRPVVEPGPEAETERCTTRFGRYRIIEEVARGGMGVVYRAVQEGLKRQVALKMLLAGDGAGEEQIKRFIREAESAARLSHPNIVQIHDIGVESGKHYFAMEFLEGESVSQVISRMGRLPPRQALKIARDSAKALHFAHENGILHRDVKPANIMLSPSEGAQTKEKDGDSVLFSSGVRSVFRVVLTDFGLAKDMSDGSALTVSGTTLGTPVYMSPEQADGDLGAITQKSDVYSLGAVLYEMVTGAEPFKAPNLGQLLSKVIHEEPVAPRKLLPGIHRDLETIITTAMAKEPSRRYPSALALAEDIDRYLKGEAILARPASLPYRASKFLKRHKAVTAAALLVAAVLAAAVAQNRLASAARNRGIRAAALRQYGAGVDLLAGKDFIEAEKAFANAIAIMPGFDEAKREASAARLARLLDRTRSLLDEQQWKAAGYVLEEIQSFAADNAEAAELAKIQRGTGTLAVLGRGFSVFTAPPGAPLAVTSGAMPRADVLKSTKLAWQPGEAPFGPVDLEPGERWLVFVRDETVESAFLLDVKRGEDLRFERRYLKVEAAGGGDFRTIAEAIEAATPGAVIEVGLGEYREKIAVCKRALTIRPAKGARPEIVSSDGKGVLRAKGADGLRIEGLLLRSEEDHVVLAEASPGFSILDCFISGGTKEAVMVRGCPQALIAGNEVSGGKEPGIKIEGSAYGAVVGNFVHDCGWAGIICSSDDTAVGGNRVERCTRAGIFVNLTRRGEITDNAVSDCGEWGIILSEKTYNTRASFNIVSRIGSGAEGRKATGLFMGKNDGSDLSFNTVTGCFLGISYSFSPRSKCYDNIVAKCDIGVQWHESGDMDYNCFFDCRLLGYMIEKRVNTLEELRKAYEWKGQMMAHGLVADPKFTAPDKGDYSLRPDSPCRKAASNGGHIGADWGRAGPVARGEFDKDRWLARRAATRCAKASDESKKAGRADEAAALLKLGLAFKPGDPNLMKKLEALKSGR